MPARKCAPRQEEIWTSPLALAPEGIATTDDFAGCARSTHLCQVSVGVQACQRVNVVDHGLKEEWLHKQLRQPGRAPAQSMSCIAIASPNLVPKSTRHKLTWHACQ